MPRNTLSDLAARIDAAKWERARANDAAIEREPDWSAQRDAWSATVQRYALLRRVGDGAVPVDYYRTISGARHAAWLLNIGAATVNPHAAQGCRVVPNHVEAPRAISPSGALLPSAWGRDAARIAAQDAHTAR